jgi:hypothetical protein
MSDPVNMARTARERLAQALGALQSPGGPAELLGVAEPVAHAMCALHQIESTGGTARPQAAPRALDGVRRALQALQGDTSGHAAVLQAMESVASSLSLVHGLTTNAAAAAPPAAAVVAPRPPAVAPAMPGGPPTQPSPAPRGGAPSAQRPAAAAPAQAAAPWPPQAPPPQAYAAPPQAAAPQAFPQAAPAHAAPVAPQAVRANPNAPASAAGGTLKVNAELGVHSATNFYKGLSGNDLFDSGGIFIATYQIPKIGKELIIHVSMPGGYEFDAKGIVRWTREAPLSGPAGLESPPGFGAQFTDLSAEGRQLIQRYVRNREPLFHDDL